MEKKIINQKMINKKLGHLMVDIETLGNTSNSVICSIAAVEFDLATGETGKVFSQNISIESCLNAGLKVDASTIEWWMKQEDEARSVLLPMNAPALNFVLRDFFSFILFVGDENLQIWGNGARFDLGLISDAAVAVKMDLPWKHWQERDVRTVVSFAPEVKKNTIFDGVKHEPIADCNYQIKYCSAIYQRLTNCK